jgi:hypothetical protein
MNKNIISLILTTIAVALIIFGFLGPWYNFQFDIRSNIIEMDVKYEFDFYLSKANFQGQIFGRSVSQTEDYDNIINLLSQIPGNSSKSSSINQVFGVFETTQLFVFFTLIISIMTFVGSAASVLFSNIKNYFRDFNIFLGVLFSGLSFCSFFYFFISWNNVIQRGLSLLSSTAGSITIPSQISDAGFWFSFNQDGTNISMGPGSAWYFMILAGIFGLIVFVLTLTSNTQDNYDK